MAQPQNLCILWDFRHFDAAVLTPSSEVATLPARNLQDPQRTRPWRTTGITNQYLIMDYGVPRVFNALAIIDHNFTPEAEITLQASDSPSFTPLLFNETYQAWEEVIGAGELGAGEHGAWGYFLDEERSFYVPNPTRILYFSQLPDNDEIEARYWRTLFNDPANPDGYFQIGRMALCRFDEYTEQFEFGFSLPGEDQSVINTSPGGQSHIDSRPFKRVRRFSWEYLPEEDLYWKFNLFQEKMGLSGRFIVDAFPAGRPSERFFNLLYCRNLSVSEPKAQCPGQWQVGIEVIEEK